MLGVIFRAERWSQESVARFIKIDFKTLRKHYSRELDQTSDLIEGAALRARANYYMQTALTNGARFLLPQLGGKAAPFPDLPLDRMVKVGTRRHLKTTTALRPQVLRSLGRFSIEQHLEA